MSRAEREKDLNIFGHPGTTGRCEHPLRVDQRATAHEPAVCIIQGRNDRARIPDAHVGTNCVIPRAVHVQLAADRPVWRCRSKLVI